jgi:FkbM family methyltransferase
MSRVIIDLGANDGSNLSYYLERADKVFAIEANPVLCKRMERLFEQEIQIGRLLVVNAAIIPANLNGEGLSEANKIEFWVNKKNDEISSLLKPAVNPLDYFNVHVPAITIKDFFSQHIRKQDIIHYCKIDVEGIDELILRDMFSESIFPEYISAEAQNINSFSRLISASHYNSFNYRSASQMLKGSFPDKKKLRTPIKPIPGRAGNFGSDLTSGWYNAGDTALIMSLQGFAWNDIHARKNNEFEDPAVSLRLIVQLLLIKLIRILYQASLSPSHRNRVFVLRLKVLGLVSRIKKHTARKQNKGGLNCI